MSPPPGPDSPAVMARVHEGLEVVDHLVRQLGRTLGPKADRDELRAVGREAALISARSFDEARGVPFRRWVNLRARGAMIDSVRASSNLPRRVHARLRALEASDRMQSAYIEDDCAKPTPSEVEADARLSSYLAGLATAMAVGLIAPVAAGSGDVSEVPDGGESADEQLARAQMIALVRAAMERCSDAERTLIERHYFEGVTFEQAAREIGLSKSWASRLHARAIEGIARSLGA